MPRIRSLHPEFFADEDLGKMPFECRIAYQGLWCYADREGRLEDRPEFLKAVIFPYNPEVDMQKILSKLEESKENSHQPYIIRYAVEGRKYIQILSFRRWQSPHKTERESRIPPCENLCEALNGYLTVKAPLNNGGLTVCKDSYKDSYKDSCTGSDKDLDSCTSTLSGKPDHTHPPTEEVNNSQDIEEVTKEEDNIPYEEIIAHLNDTINANYSPKSQKTKELIRARWREGFRLEDFKTVHRKKAMDWGTQDKMRPYLRPITLYSPKFESYLNQPEETHLSPYSLRLVSSLSGWA